VQELSTPSIRAHFGADAQSVECCSGTDDVVSADSGRRDDWIVSEDAGRRYIDVAVRAAMSKPSPRRWHCRRSTAFDTRTKYFFETVRDDVVKVCAVAPAIAGRRDGVPSATDKVVCNRGLHSVSERDFSNEKRGFHGEHRQLLRALPL
jgi:hypothetical protein